jgi:transcriptional regulator with XRE-family HTH domain
MDKFLAIFEEIRKLRKEKHITLKKMAEETGISINYLSQIERGKTNPSVGILKRITSVLGVSLLGLGGEPLRNSSNQQGVAVVRRNMRKMLIYPKSKLKEYLLTPDLKRKLEVLLSESKPGKEKEDVWYSHEGEEFGLVLKGQYEVTVEDKTYILNEGDSIYFPSHLPHKMRGIGRKRCETLWVITPPSF